MTSIYSTKSTDSTSDNLKQFPSKIENLINDKGVDSSENLKKKLMEKKKMAENLMEEKTMKEILNENSIILKSMISKNIELSSNENTNKLNKKICEILKKNKDSYDYNKVPDEFTLELLIQIIEPEIDESKDTVDNDLEKKSINIYEYRLTLWKIFYKNVLFKNNNEKLKHISLLS